MEEVQVLLARLDERMEHVLASLREIEARLEQQNGRLRNLEQWRNLMVGGLVVIVTVVGWALSILPKGG